MMNEGLRKKNANWLIFRRKASGRFPYEAAHLAVLMDLRDELRAIRKNTTKRKYVRRKK